jgi:hypothetical protein
MFRTVTIKSLGWLGAHSAPILSFLTPSFITLLPTLSKFFNPSLWSLDHSVNHLWFFLYSCTLNTACPHFLSILAFCNKGTTGWDKPLFFVTILCLGAFMPQSICTWYLLFSEIPQFLRAFAPVSFTVKPPWSFYFKLWYTLYCYSLSCYGLFFLHCTYYYDTEYFPFIPLKWELYNFVHCNQVPRRVLGTSMVINKYLLIEDQALRLHFKPRLLGLEKSLSCYSMSFHTQVRCVGTIEFEAFVGAQGRDSIKYLCIGHMVPIKILK